MLLFYIPTFRCLLYYLASVRTCFAAKSCPNVYFQLVGGVSLLLCVLNRFYAASSHTVSDFVTIPELINDYFCVAMKQSKT